MQLVFVPIVAVVSLILIYNLRDYLVRISRYISFYLLVITVVLLVISIVIYPKEAVEASYKGLMTWFTIVLPSLLPFFVGAEMMIGLGVVRFIGTLLEPIMRPIFKVPGEGSFVFAMSITSGYPVGVKIATKLRQENAISRVEAQRLAAFCSTSGPLFILGAIGVGMYQSSQVGVFLAICHYSAAILVGLLFRFYKSKDLPHQIDNKKNRGILQEAFHQLNLSRRRRSPLGLLMGTAVKESINTILVVGGFIIVFSVIIRILQLVGFISLMAEILYLCFEPFSINLKVFEGLITGFFEITIGSKLVAEVPQASLLSKLVITSFIVAWSGLSIHAQSFSILNQTDIKPSIYIISKLLHGIFSACLAFIIYPFSGIHKLSVPASGLITELSPMERILTSFKLSVELFLIITITLLIISLVLSFFSTLLKTKK